MLLTHFLVRAERIAPYSATFILSLALLVFLSACVVVAPTDDEREGAPKRYTDPWAEDGITTVEDAVRYYGKKIEDGTATLADRERYRIASERLARAYIKEAWNALNNGDIDFARRFLDESRKYSEDDPDIVRGREKLSLEIEKTRDMVEGILPRARQVIESGKPHEALFLLEPISKYAPNYPAIGKMIHEALSGYLDNLVRKAEESAGKSEVDKCRGYLSNAKQVIDEYGGSRYGLVLAKLGRLFREAETNYAHTATIDRAFSELAAARFAEAWELINRAREKAAGSKRLEDAYDEIRTSYREYLVAEAKDLASKGSAALTAYHKYALAIELGEKSPEVEAAMAEIGGFAAEKLYSAALDAFSEGLNALGYIRLLQAFYYADDEFRTEDLEPALKEAQKNLRKLLYTEIYVKDFKNAGIAGGYYQRLNDEIKDKLEAALSDANIRIIYEEELVRRLKKNDLDIPELTFEGALYRFGIETKPDKVESKAVHYLKEVYPYRGPSPTYVPAVHVYEVYERVKIAAARGGFTFFEYDTGRKLGERLDVASKLDYIDEFTSGAPEHDIPSDPLQMPSDYEIYEDLLRSFSDSLVLEMVTALAYSHYRFVEAAGHYEKDGETDKALNAYLLYLLRLDRYSLERETEVSRKVEGLLGYSVKTRKVVPEKITLDTER